MMKVSLYVDCWKLLSPRNMFLPLPVLGTFEGCMTGTYLYSATLFTENNLGKGASLVNMWVNLFFFSISVVIRKGYIR